MQFTGPRVLSRKRHSVRSRPLLVLRAAPWRTLESHIKAEQLLARAKQFFQRPVVSSALLAVGSALCTYVLASYLWMYVHQRLLLREWQKNSSGSAHEVAKLSIPRIHLEAVVLEGASQHTLLEGPAHLSETALPGMMGNSVIAGHRDTFFRHIHSLRVGDGIDVLRGGTQFHYTVISRRVVDPKDLSVLSASKDGELTLITCYPTHAIGPAPKRLIVVASLAKERLFAESERQNAKLN
jgi:sortase A